jgi:hypothetical protein
MNAITRFIYSWEYRKCASKGEMRGAKNQNPLISEGAWLFVSWYAIREVLFKGKAYVKTVKYR